MSNIYLSTDIEIPLDTSDVYDEIESDIRDLIESVLDDHNGVSDGLTERLDHIERRLDDMAHVLRTINEATKYF